MLDCKQLLSDGKEHSSGEAKKQYHERKEQVFKAKGYGLYTLPVLEGSTVSLRNPVVFQSAEDPSLFQLLDVVVEEVYKLRVLLEG